MKNYYFNQKTQDLMIFDTESREMLVLERIEGIRVLTSSELRSPGGDEPVKKWSNSVWDPTTGKAGYKGQRLKKAKKVKAAKPAKKGGKWKCKNCGELGHGAKTCKNPQRPVPPPFPFRKSPMKKSARSRRRSAR
jgi:hypothetical protein